jgi:DNA-binding response OmpR family regulator
MRVLYVEDESFLGKIVKESLESRGFEVHLIEDGGKVMAAFQEVQPDICLFDVMLPNEDGFSLTKKVKALDPDMPVLFLTAKSQSKDVVEGFESGGNDYLRKPFSMEELILRMKNLLHLTQSRRGIETQNHAEVKIGHFVFSPIRQTLVSDKAEHSLSHRESELLNYLYQNRFDIIDRRKLLKEIWGDDTIFNSRNLDVYISKLRNMLQQDGKVEIRTLKGVGYRFFIQA